MFRSSHRGQSRLWACIVPVFAPRSVTPSGLHRSCLMGLSSGQRVVSYFGLSRRLAACSGVFVHRWGVVRAVPVLSVAGHRAEVSHAFGLAFRSRSCSVACQHSLLVRSWGGPPPCSCAAKQPPWLQLLLSVCYAAAAEGTVAATESHRREIGAQLPKSARSDQFPFLEIGFRNIFTRQSNFRNWFSQHVCSGNAPTTGTKNNSLAPSTLRTILV